MEPIVKNVERKSWAVKFGARLDRAMTDRKVGSRTIEEATGLTRSTIRQYRAGYNLPALETARILAGALACPELEEICLAGRTHPCQTCRRPFVDGTGTPTRYCSERCRQISAKRHAGTDARLRAYTLENALSEYDLLVGEFVATVDAFCHECSPEGKCVMPKCQLRPLSPLPLDRPVAGVPIQPKQGVWSPERREETLARIRKSNAARWARPGERERQAEAMVRSHQKRRSGGRTSRTGEA